MSQTAVLRKILHVREQEQKDAQVEQLKATDSFEEVAKNLYRVLKTKEQAEEGLEQSMQKKATITRIKEQASYIDTLNKKIAALQRDVQVARQKMEVKQEKLTETHIEVKKIEKIIENREQERIKHERKLEMMEMDEISIRQFMTQVQNR